MIEPVPSEAEAKTAEHPLLAKLSPEFLSALDTTIKGILGIKDPLAKPIDYIDPAPKPFIVQIPLIEYFERIKRLKTDRWQKDFFGRLQDAVVNRHLKSSWQIFHAQPQLGKTIGLSQVFPAWCLGHDPLFRYVLAMYNISRSEAHSDVIIQIMRSQLHRDIFPDKAGHLPNSVSKAGWMTNARRDVEGGRMDAQRSLNPVGLESGMTGSGMDWLTIDDPYKEPRDAFSETTYENLARFWEYGVKPRLSEHSCIAAMFHRYSYDDFGGYLLNTGKFEYVRYAAEADGDYVHDETGQRFADPLSRMPGELISPERFPQSYYTDKSEDSKVWLSMFQGRPGREEGDFFQVNKIQVITDPVQCKQEWAACTLKGRGWDNAATEGAGDRSAGGLVGLQTDGTAIIADVFSAQLDSASRVAKQKELAENDGQDVTVVIPEELAASGKDVVFFTKQELRDFNVVARKVTNATPGSTAKMRRAYNFSVAVNSGKVKFLAGEWNDRLKRLMRRFGSSISGDDEIDGISDAYNYLYEESTKGLVIKNFQAERNLLPLDKFIERFPYQENGGSPVFKIPALWSVYAGVKIQAEAHKASSAIIVARAAENTDLPDDLFVIDEYKAYDADLYKLFAWLGETLKRTCEDADITVWLHPDSASYQPTVVQKLDYDVDIFKERFDAGIAEMNWYLLPTDQPHPFALAQQASHLHFLTGKKYLLTPDKDVPHGFYHARQEASTWGYNERGEPTKVGDVLDCLRMVTFLFRTYSEPRTYEELYKAEVSKHYKVKKSDDGRVLWSKQDQQKAQFAHYMAKEILKEQGHEEETEEDIFW